MMPIYNFSAGPSMLPEEVLQQAQQELCGWRAPGISVMEISHRSKEFIEQVVKESEENLRALLNIPKNYKVLFCQGGAQGQFSAVPLNLLGENQTADYIKSGHWSAKASEEAKRYCEPNIIDVTTKINDKDGIKPMKEWGISDNSAYIHYCPNETVDGVAIHELPDFSDKIVVADYSSAILSQPLDVARFGMIYAGAQKNIGPAGLTLVIIREDLLGKADKKLPSILNYKTLAENGSMFNTPPTFAWYLTGLVFKWLQKQGGLKEMEKRNKVKKDLLYKAIDNSRLYYCNNVAKATRFYCNNVADANRSWMNVTFRLPDDKLYKHFFKESKAAGLHALKGHQAVGGIRASIYNAMPIEGVKALTNFMTDFEKRYCG